jgi:hypothetical protein
MNTSIRPTSIGDLDTVRNFLKQAFNTSRDPYFLDPAVMAWKYWDCRGDWEGPRSYVLERDGIIVAHAGIYPLTFFEGEVRGVHLIDWASAHGSPGAGFALLQRMITMFDFLYGIGVSEMTRKILSASGFIEYARQWKGARTIRPFQQILRYQYRNWKVGPRVVRNLLLSSPKAAEHRLEEDWKSEEISPDAVSEEFYPQIAADVSPIPRLPEFFEYLHRCPVMKIRLYRIQAKHGPRGHFAIGVLHGQARVAGVWLRDPIPDEWQAAYSLAQQTAMRLKDACEILIAGTEGPSEQGATRSGLRITEHKPIYILNRKGKLTLPPGFQFQLSDDDGWFLDAG